MIRPILLILLLSATMLNAQKVEPDFLKNILETEGSALLKNILSKPDSFRYQIIYTRIDRDKNNKPHFSESSMRLNKDEYFNPASMVKMPLAFLALEKLNKQGRAGVNKFTTMLTDSSYSAQTPVTADSTAEDGLPSIAHYIKKIFLISDNDAYTRLYEYLGQQYINEQLWKKGYNDIRITRRFAPFNEEENRHTNQIRFVKGAESIYVQPPSTSTIKFDFPKQVLLGKAYYNRDEKLINEPMDFTKHNNVPLKDLQQILQSVMFPESVLKKQRFDLSKEDYSFLYRYMSSKPRESNYPKYDTTEYFDSYTKFFLFKSEKKPIPSGVRVFNKTGWAYGFLTDVSYFVDFNNNVEFMLSALIYVNSDGVLNDDKYDYDDIGLPFFKEAGEIIYKSELGRKRKYAPDLSKFKCDYSH